jgi:hypothetical protein
MELHMEFHPAGLIAFSIDMNALTGKPRSSFIVSIDMNALTDKRAIRNLTTVLG